MLDKNDVLDAILTECDIALHLYGKLPEGSLEYRPTPEQRSTEELLRYLSFCAIGGARTMVEGDWDGYGEVAQRAERQAAEDFPSAMERQKEELRALFDGISDADFSEKSATTPLGEQVKLCRGLLDLPLKWMVGYRMQLFLYAKAAGNKDIGTANCWAGIDWEGPAPTAE
jgi:hypothetical protein